MLWYKVVSVFVDVKDLENGRFDSVKLHKGSGRAGSFLELLNITKP